MLRPSTPTNQLPTQMPMQVVPARLRMLLVLGVTATLGLLVVSVRPAGAAATVLYVDGSNPSCSDSGSGTQTIPYCTITKGASVAIGGQTVQVAAGTYAQLATIGHSGSPDAPIVLTPAPGATVTVTGQANGFKASSKSYVTIQGFTVTNTTSYGIYITGSSNITVSGNTVSGTAGAGIYVTSASSNVTVDGNTVSGSATYGIYDNGSPNTTISNNTVSGTTSYGIQAASTSGVTISGNNVSDSGHQVSGETKYGIKLTAMTGSVASGNASHDNSEAGIFLDANTNGVEVTGNQTYGNARGYARAAPGIDVRGHDNTIDRNVSHDNEDSGLQFYTDSHDNLVVDNLSYDNGDHGIDDLNSTGQRIISNTVYNNVAAGINVEGTSTGATIEDNISVDNGINSPRTKSNIRVDSNSTSGTTVNYNLVYLSVSGQVMYVWGSSSYTSLAAFQSATGQESNGLQANPQWVSYGSNFHLTSSSPAIDSADSGVSGETSTDLEGNGRVDVSGVTNTGTGPRDYDDRGAYEYQPSLPATTTTSTTTTTTTVPTTTTTSSTTTSTTTTTTTIPGGTNLVGNASFEADLTGWKAYGSGSLQRVPGGHSGAWAAEADNPTTASASCGLNDSPNWIATTQAGTYTVSVWVRGAVANSVKLNVREYASGTNVGAKTVTVTASPTWQLASLTYTIVSPGSTLDLNTYSSSAAPGQCFQADDVSETLS